MNRLVYYYTATDGTEYKMYSYEQVNALVDAEGGRYRAVCEPIVEKPNIFAKNLERRVKATPRVR